MPIYQGEMNSEKDAHHYQLLSTVVCLRHAHNGISPLIPTSLKLHELSSTNMKKWVSSYVVSPTSSFTQARNN